MNTVTCSRANSKSARKGDRKATPRPTERTFHKLALKLAQARATKYALAYDGFNSSQSNPALNAMDYSSDMDFKHDYMLYNLLRKFLSNDESKAALREQAAIDKFKETDAALAHWNEYLDWSNPDLYEDHEIVSILRRARNKVAKILGPCPSLSDLADHAGFSGGATFSTPRIEGDPRFKYSYECVQITYGFHPIATLLQSEEPIWAKRFELVPGNRITTVPKDADIDRPIACEPLYNMRYQKAVGKIIRRCLKSVGINLNYQQKVNQDLAREGSITGKLATIDLSAASDSISLGICRLLLPRQWYLLLLALRSDKGVLPNGDTLVYNKMSSMGNGFTFELETLLFFSLAQASEEAASYEANETARQCSVYGDDIIISSHSVDLLVRVLTYTGFTTNKDKSFWEGPFRESCGKHYFNGTDVTPFFIRDMPTHYADLFVHLNNMRRWAGVFGFMPEEYQAGYDYLLNFIPAKWRQPRLPDGMGDGALLGRFDECHRNFNRNGTYVSHVWSKRHLQIDDPDDKQYKQLATVYTGKGGYLAALASKQSRASDVDMSKRSCDYVVEAIDKASRHSVRPADTTETVEPMEVPGIYIRRSIMISIVDWLDWDDRVSSLTTLDRFTNPCDE
uniref:RNA-directed RNA polymerase n=1 Tax=Beihai levi-like virus 15 TaxID=1922400 RepID=A0A1L3KIE7_9VIRU|nr:hypothetical protein [Beihai levi-like virus 15]